MDGIRDKISLPLTFQILYHRAQRRGIFRSEVGLDNVEKGRELVGSQSLMQRIRRYSFIPMLFVDFDDAKLS